MSLSFWLYGLVAVTIALLLSSVELLNQHHSRRLQEIFFSRYYCLFALLNVLFCGLVYWALPSLSRVVIKTEFAASVDEGLVRAVVSGLGYLVIARMSILDITTKDGTTYGAGFDFIYNTFAQYLLDHHRRQIQRGIRENFSVIYASVSANERAVFRQAATLIMAGLGKPEEQIAFKNRLELAETNFPSNSPKYCSTLYQLILDYTTGPQEASQQIQQIQQIQATPGAEGS